MMGVLELYDVLSFYKTRSSVPFTLKFIQLPVCEMKLNSVSVITNT